MTSLASLMGAMMTAIQVHPVCKRVSVVETEEFPDISSYPHHHHDPLGNILPSALTGDPHKDVLIVLDEAASFIDRLRE